MKIVHVASEFSPWVQVGDLGEVVGGLAHELARLGHEVSVFLPGYRQVLADPRAARAELVFEHTLELGDALITADTLRVEAEKNLTLYLVRRDESFDRSYPYGPPGGEYEDSDTRFVIFCKAVADALCRLDGGVDVLHAHDWTAALAPLYVRLEERKRGASAVARTVFSIHQLAFQGIFPRRTFAQMNLPEEFFAADGLEFYGQVNLLKAGILFADALAAPSPAAAREMQTPEFGFGIEGALARRREDFHGLLTGCDAPTPAAVAGPRTGQARRSMLKKLGFEDNAASGPLFVTQPPLSTALGLSGPNELMLALEHAAIVALTRAGGAGGEAWQNLAGARPGRVVVVEDATPDAAAQVLGGADFFLGAARMEPSPLSAQRAMQLGAVPVMARTGGPENVITDIAQNPGTGTGILFEPTLDGWLNGVARARALWEARKELEAVRARAMAVDSSWQKHAAAYVKLYSEIL